MSKIPERMSAFKRTHDEWYGNYKIANDARVSALVEVSLIKMPKYKDSPIGWRVCVWGNDDFGMERDYNDTDKDSAVAMFHQVISWDFVNIGQLKTNGFVHA